MQKGVGGTFLEKRRGVVNDDWNDCDCTPCICDKKAKRLRKKKWRQNDRKIIREQMGDLGL